MKTRGLILAIDGKALRAAIEKVKDYRVLMVMNVVDTVTGLVLAQLPIQNKDCEITLIPKLLEFLDIKDSTITIDSIGTQTEIMTKTQEEWPFLKTVGHVRQVRMVRDAEGNDITQDIETFLNQGSRRQSKPVKGDGEASDIQEVGMISDLELKADEMGQVKRAHW